MKKPFKPLLISVLGTALFATSIIAASCSSKNKKQESPKTIGTSKKENDQLPKGYEDLPLEQDNSNKKEKDNKELEMQANRNDKKIQKALIDITNSFNDLKLKIKASDVEKNIIEQYAPTDNLVNVWKKLINNYQEAINELNSFEEQIAKIEKLLNVVRDLDGLNQIKKLSKEISELNRKVNESLEVITTKKQDQENSIKSEQSKIKDYLKIFDGVLETIIEKEMFPKDNHTKTAIKLYLDDLVKWCNEYILEPSKKINYDIAIKQVEEKLKKIEEFKNQSTKKMAL
ncbi:hypothetical lipoprotein [Metamycoplasma arthritidis]|uniref:Hypothetical lipoprotein n=1 Tax=Metamycoplasma arthritidis (strain 158L3-1) TaxID=243272 RepID=B3PM87_META1|nr:hypothetical protein [Metamycoplasma arthritidis]ACF07139.1 hypothetical lipoprotein [Metamycoplasma arthritidis 158L3-1]VEU78665.1 hypothetical lipoprotein [Metamycoplasma arthritidis]